ncbi:MAG: glycoside hydrolase family 3 N-terminal domain-containing protein [Bacteroidales bacterium]|nr:glycoside hydrolase family 3 N-terminal domain-containing protein [Bacteroidales bacterium]MDT8373866.1 glycoside hydrolase family 3 N-terminal domain-containing protein [Bacteroidales bacterium]
MNTLKPSLVALFLLTALLTNSCKTETPFDDGADARAEKMVARMTLDEKIGQMSQLFDGYFSDYDQFKQAIRDGRFGSLLNYHGPDKVNEAQRIAVEESRLGIPLLIGRDVIHGYRTIFPIPLGMAASWNPEAVKEAFRIAAAEASTQGINWAFAPMIDITWDPRWGRIAEGCGEDPYLASTLAYAMVEGLQGDSLTDPGSVAACAKHYAGYGFSEAGRDYNTTYITEPVLRNVVLKPFKAAKDAGALTFMSGFNELNGIPVSANEFILKQILRDEWGFDGFVISDWASVPQIVDQGYAFDEKDAAAKAIVAGIDMEMATTTYFENIKALLDEKKITMEQIDIAVKNILRVKYKLGLFENPYIDPEAEKKIPDPAFLEHARKVARQSTVMLKNDNNTLPLFADEISSVAVIGPLADSPRDQMGTWSFDGLPENSVTPLEAIRDLIGDRKVNYVQALKYSRDKSKDQFSAALAAAGRSDAILLFIGEEWILSGEGQSRGNIDLPGAQSELLTALAATGKPLVVIVMAGRPLAIGDELKESDALLYAWHGGNMAGPALADLIFGKESPSGKLPVTFVKGEGQIPFYYYRKNTGRPASDETWTPIDEIPVENPQSSLGYESFHLDYGYTPLLPFGYGLSYTTFTYSDLILSDDSMSTTGSITVKARVTNSGEWDADEIVQLYIRDRVGTITRPIKELKGYRRLTIPKGETTEVEFTLTAADLAYFNGKETVTEPGEFDLWIGPNSDEGLHADFIIR